MLCPVIFKGIMIYPKSVYVEVATSEILKINFRVMEGKKNFDILNFLPF